MPATKKSSRAFRLRNIEPDELHSFEGAKHPDEQDSNLEEVSQHWTHVAMARESSLMLEVVIGPRTQESATELVEGAARRLATGCWSLWSSDGWEPYLFALTVVFAVLIHFIKGQGRGRPKDPQVVPDTRAHYRHFTLMFYSPAPDRPRTPDALIRRRLRLTMPPAERRVDKN